MLWKGANTSIHFYPFPTFYFFFFFFFKFISLADFIFWVSALFTYLLYCSVYKITNCELLAGNFLSIAFSHHNLFPCYLAVSVHMKFGIHDPQDGAPVMVFGA